MEKLYYESRGMKMPDEGSREDDSGDDERLINHAGEPKGEAERLIEHAGEPKGKEYKCTFEGCTAEFDTNKELGLHKWHEHKIHAEKKEIKNGVKCYTCDLVCKSPRGLKKHYHSKPDHAPPGYATREVPGEDEQEGDEGIDRVRTRSPVPEPLVRPMEKEPTEDLQPTLDNIMAVARSKKWKVRRLVAEVGQSENEFTITFTVKK